MSELPARPTLADYQAYVGAMEVERGFQRETAVEKCLLLGEEVGELFKAVRKAEGIPIETGARTGSVPDELADVLIYLCSIANRYQVDLAEAFVAKEKVNKGRVWVGAGPAGPA